MEPNHNNFASLPELPPPQEAGVRHPSEAATPISPEVNGLQVPKPASASQPSPVGVQPQAAGLQSMSPVIDQTSQGHTPTSTLMADDADLIEKEWVNRAKSIVMQTKDDPHAQNREMNKVKADYLKKRYNKDLKISES